MKRIKFLIVWVVLSISWSCSNLDQILDNESISPESQTDIEPELSLPYRVLGEHYDNRTLTILKRICDNSTGYRLIDFLSYSIRLNFVPTEQIPGGTMIYAGEGFIYYNAGKMNDDESICQTGKNKKLRTS